MSCHVTSDPVNRRQSCSQCLRPLSVCYCSQIPCQQHNSWPIRIVQDIRESTHAIGTARIAALSLSDCRLISINPDKGGQSADLQALKLLQPVLIYPGHGARNVAELSEAPKAPLLFIDASWRRSRKILLTQPWIAALPRFALTTGLSSRYRIRQQPDATALSTLEAVVFTLQQIETEPERFDSLLSTMDWVVDQQINHMGSDTWRSNYSKADYPKYNKES